MRDLLGDQVLDLLLERSRDGAGGLRLTGEGSMLGELVKAVLERALEAELSSHLGYGKHEVAGHGSGNSRNGRIGKTVQTGVGPVRLAVPRDRAGTFEPVLVPKRAGRVSGGLDDLIISLYAHGMSVRDIQHHLRQIYDTDLSHEAISNITDAVLEEVRTWQARPLEAVYPVVFLDAIVVKVRDNHSVQAKPAYLAVGIDADGDKHVLGIWLAKTPLDAATAGESARFWSAVMNDLRNRGVRDILIACTDALADFSASTWGQRYPQAARVFETAWDRFIPFFAFSPAVRKLLYTTNSIESLNYQLRKVTKARGHFPGDDAVVKLLWLAIINIEDKRARERAVTKEKTGKIKNSPSTARLIEGQRTIGWREALIELDIAYPGRIR